MSRIGKMPIPVPSGVDFKLEGNVVTVKGPNGTLSRELHKDMIIKFEDGVVTVTRPSDVKEHRALHGLTRTLIANMVEGVSKGFEKILEIYGVGFKAELKGNVLTLALGYAHPCVYQVPEGITVVVGELPDRNPMLTVSGASKHLVGQVAADIKNFYPVEPYKGKGVRIRGEFIRRKEGKKTA